MLAHIILLAAVLVLAVSDYKTHRIPNKITFPLMAAGLILCVVSGNIRGLFERLIVCMVIFLFGSLRLVGLGDIKMLMMSCCLIGGVDSIYLFLAAHILLLIYCLITATKDTLMMLKDTLHFLTLQTPIPKRTDRAYPVAVPYAVVYVAYFVYLLTIWRNA